MQQSSATQSLHLSFWGLQKIVAYSHSSSQCLLVSTVFGVIPTFYFIFNDCKAHLHIVLTIHMSTFILVIVKRK